MNESAIEWSMETQKLIHTKPPLPPFTRETAVLKVRLAEDAWNSRDPESVALAYTPNSRWRNRFENWLILSLAGFNDSDQTLD